ncbi:site-specific DNA-methyltransferase [Patescibacteria group bacterium]|nr:site-specific DNA-methyltransferase [Candidatus Falkowbacteria bacterium]MBU3906518.1 site-specific DNA-methyltransferase [Patescibacteria group bacterium]MCG2698268.1 site-specific DNA-methyltransferase [Candidatus Parcubacteria bacterium]MBU4014912.1 site-specific DNA-methyltransferase [Patescibacteria group bacterium]MBU4026931.1 site-specific DNA-methyltransferase [Patescibacteria group bacterium]
MSSLLTIKQASQFASQCLNKNITTSNISYLIQYGRVKKINENGNTQIVKQDLVKYYNAYQSARKITWKKQLGNDLNWALSFEQYKEAETTKHVHRLHPYKGKFIPQLVEYFLDNHTDNFKKEIYFKKEDIVLDPFCGSGTMLVQASELGMHAIGIDISAFNAFISNIKIEKHNFSELRNELQKITNSLIKFVIDLRITTFENELLEELKKFNNKYFPVPEYKYKAQRGIINEVKYGIEKEKEFLKVYQSLIKKYNIKLKQNKTDNFIDKWYFQSTREEIDFAFSLIKKIKNIEIKKVAGIILSRTIRSCRATTHADLATLKEPIFTTYYCSKHGKICKPLFSILSWWRRYSIDTVNRLQQFDRLRTETHQICLAGDSKNIDIFKSLEKRNPSLTKLMKSKKIKGIFSSPPYVGLINYHEQHAYAYDLLGFKRQDNLEIGPLFRGQGKEARQSYIQGVSDVLNNCKKFLADDFNIFLVANDKWNMYPEIAERSGMKIVNRFKRPVLNRTEKDKGAYCEEIFYLKNLI